MATFVCDRQRLFAEAVASALRDDSRMNGAVVACATDELAEAVASDRAASRLVVLSARSGSAEDLAMVRRLGRLRPPVRIVCLTAGVEAGFAREALAAGADQVVSRTGSIVDVADAVLGGARQCQVLPGTGVQPHPYALAIRFLTARERQVLDLLVAARSTQDIADELNLTMTTTRSYVQSVLVKLSAHSRVQVVAFAMGAGSALADASGAC